MGGIVSVTQAIVERLRRRMEGDHPSGVPAQLVVVCGTNRAARTALEAWKSTLATTTTGLPAVVVVVHILGFVINMHQYMRASDILVSKAGAISVAEAALCSLPCLLYSYLPMSESGNVRYVEESGFGTYCGRPSTAAATVVDWLTHPEKLSAMRRAAALAAWPTATVDIARDIFEMAVAARVGKQQQQKQLLLLRGTSTSQ